MKLIDDKGRLFGRINIIDLAVILFILGVCIPIGISAVHFSKYRAATFGQTEKARLEKQAYDDAYTKFMASLKEEERISQEKKAAEEQRQTLMRETEKKAYEKGYSDGLKEGSEKEIAKQEAVFKKFPRLKKYFDN